MDNGRDQDDRAPGTGTRAPSPDPTSPQGAAAPDLACPDCDDALVHVHTEIASGAFRTQAASMPQRPVHFYDCLHCRTCWKFATRLLPDPVRQIVQDDATVP